MEFDLKEFKGKIIHFIGIGGISMSALAQILKKNGYNVQGSDLSENDEVKILKKKKIQVFNGHCKENLKNVSLIIYTSAIHDDNEELAFARENKIPILKRAELLGMIASEYKTIISIAGSHGKTTATAMIAEMFEKANLKPTIHIGGKDNYLKSNYKLGNKKYFITEACEYMDNYHYINSDISVILNIDSDHLDYFKNLNNVKSSFEKFSSKTKSGGIIVANYDDNNSSKILKNKNSVNFGLNRHSNIYAKNIKEYSPCKYSFDVVFYGENLGNIKLNILGRHNIFNALACVLVGMACRISFCEIVSSIENFSGVERRCEQVGEINGAKVYHDYAHHPKQIEKMISTARDYVSKTGGKIITVFEPHTYSRTKFLLDEFVSSLTKSDILILSPVYSARENESEGVNSLELLVACQEKMEKVEYHETYPEIKNRLQKLANYNDFVLILGAGNIYKLGDLFRIKN